MNITGDGLRTYLETFHDSLHQAASEFLPAGDQRRLRHEALLPARIKGYVSTQFGVAIEYVPAERTSIEVVVGSAAVEELFLNAPAVISRGAPAFVISAKSSFSGMTIAGGFPFRLRTSSARLMLQDIRFQAGSWERLVEYAEIFGNRDASFWSPAAAESRAKDEVLAAMFELQRASEANLDIAEYIKTKKSKTVLVLGDYNEDGLVRLSRISAALAAAGYNPVMVKDIPDHPHQSLSQKVVAIGAISRFVIIDNSSKSGHLVEVQIARSNEWVTSLLRKVGSDTSWMAAGSSIASNVMHELPYDPPDLPVAVKDACEWAEAKLAELERKFDDLYPWRQEAP